MAFSVGHSVPVQALPFQGGDVDLCLEHFLGDVPHLDDGQSLVTDKHLGLVADTQTIDRH